MSDKDKYTKEREAGGCESCGHGAQYAVVFDIGGPDEIQESSTYEDEDFADDLVEMLNIAYSRGLATERAAHAEELRRVEQERDAALVACKIVKEYLNVLELLPEDDPLLQLRRRYHKPLHAALDAALKPNEHVKP